MPIKFSALTKSKVKIHKFILTAINSTTASFEGICGCLKKSKKVVDRQGGFVYNNEAGLREANMGS